MDLRQLDAFVAVAEELHFGRAAERLHLAQSPLSRRVRTLEADLGVTLFARTNRRVALTDAGRTLLPAARAALGAAADVAGLAARCADGTAGTLRVGYVASVALGLLPDVLHRWRTATPDVHVELRRLATLPQLEALAAGTLDVGIARHVPGAGGPGARDGIVPGAASARGDGSDARDGIAAPRAARGLGGVRVRHLAADPFVAAVPAGTAAPADVADLAGQPWILSDGTGSISGPVRARCAAAGFEPDVRHLAPDLPSVLGLVAAGLGVALVPASLAGVAPAGADLHPLPPDPATDLELTLVWADGGEDQPVLARFLEAATAAAA